MTYAMHDAKLSNNFHEKCQCFNTYAKGPLQYQESHILIIPDPSYSFPYLKKLVHSLGFLSMVASTHTGVSRHTYTVQAEIHTVFGARLAGQSESHASYQRTKVALTHTLWLTPISRARRVRGLLRDMKRGRVFGTCYRSEGSV